MSPKALESIRVKMWQFFTPMAWIAGCLQLYAKQIRALKVRSVEMIVKRFGMVSKCVYFRLLKPASQAELKCSVHTGLKVTIFS